MKISYEEYLKDWIEMPVFDESIFYPKIENRKLGFIDEDMESIAAYFRWELNQRNRRLDRHCLTSKLRVEKLIYQKKYELARDLDTLKLFSKYLIPS